MRYGHVSVVLVAAAVVLSTVALPTFALVPASPTGQAEDTAVQSRTISKTANNSSSNSSTVEKKPPAKLTSGVIRRIERASSAGTGGVTAAERSVQRVTVRIDATAGSGDRVSELVQNNNGRVQVRHRDQLVVRLPATAITGLTNSAAIQMITLPDQGAHTGGNITSEGVGSMNVLPVHDAGYTGENVTVAVIDSAFNVSNPEIRDNVIATKNISGGTFKNRSGTHGTATAELVVDTAPNVSLILVSAPNLYGTSIKKAIQYIDRNTSADIVSMSLGFQTGPFDGSSEIDQLIADSVNNGTAYVVSAGNAGDKKHHTVAWNDSDDDGRLNFEDTDERLEIQLPSSNSLGVYVSWRDYPSSDEDYDMKVLNNEGDVVARSTDRQTGTQEPDEEIFLSGAYNPPYELIIENYDANGSATFDIFVRDGHELEYSTRAYSLTRPAAEETAITVGAVRYDTLTVEAFSSRGPTVDGRQKPDLVAPDRVSSSVYGSAPNGFYGTSAAAPETAGIAALLLAAEGSLTPIEIKQQLQQSADARNRTKPNYQTGYGLVNASAAVSSVTGTTIDATATLTVDPDGSGDYTTISAAVSHAGDGDRIEVRPGTYHERVEIDRNVTLVAPAGATLNGSTLQKDRYGFIIPDSHPVNPTIRGFTVTDYQVGVLAHGARAGWTLRNTTIRNTTYAIYTPAAAGDWQIERARLTENQVAVFAPQSRGNWSLLDSRVSRNTEGIKSNESSGAWQIRNTTFAENGGTFTDGTTGETIDARNTSGPWTIRDNRFNSSRELALNATNAAPTGNATRNWWNASSGPSGAFAGDGVAVTGNVAVQPYYTDAALTNLSDTLQAAPGNFSITGVTAPSRTVIGSNVTVTATVENIGTNEGTQSVAYRFDFDQNGTLERNETVRTQNVTLAPGANATVTFEFDTDGGAAGVYEYGLVTANDSYIATAELINASITFTDRAVANGTIAARVDSVTYTGGPFYLVAHERFDNGTISGPIGNSSLLSNGTQGDVWLNLSATAASSDTVGNLSADTTLVAMIHKADTANGTFGKPVTRDSTPVASTATIDVLSVPSMFSIRPRNSTIDANETFDIAVSLNSTESTDTAEATLTYNTTLLDVTNVSQGSILTRDGAASTVVTAIDEANGTIAYTERRENVTSGITGNGTLFTVTFTPNVSDTAPVTSELGLQSVSVTHQSGLGIPTESSGGSVTLSQSPPTVDAQLLTKVNNVGAPLRIEATASDNSRVLAIAVRAPNGSIVANASCENATCTRVLSNTPAESTWNASGYQLATLTVAATDDAGSENTTTVQTAVYISGDITGDGAVDIFDAVKIGSSWKATRGERAYSAAADLNNDGTINILDAVSVGSNWQQTAA